MISFVVPAYNEEHELPGTLAAIRDAAKDRPFEIIVVDDGSTDATVAVAELAGARVISISRRHIAAARNTGGRAATGDVLFFVDADTRINQAHVDGAIAALQGGFSGGGARVAILTERVAAPTVWLSSATPSMATRSKGGWSRSA